MLERASTCLETGGRQLWGAPKRSLSSRRMLHSSFWHHGASELSLPIWWASASIAGRTNGDLDDYGWSRTYPRRSRSNDGLLLDFLYPEKTIAMIQRISTYGLATIESRRKHQLNGSGIRRFSTTRWTASDTDIDLLDPQEVELRMEVEAKEMELKQEVKRRLRGSTASDALQTLIQSNEPEKQELAWRLYSAIKERSRTPDLQADLLEYLSSHTVSVDASRVLQIFDSLPPQARRASSYRTAITAYVVLRMVGPAVQLHEEAARRFGGLDCGTDVLLRRTVQDNQWDISLRVLKTFRQETMEAFGRYAAQEKANESDNKQFRKRTKAFKKDFKAVWAIVARLPNLHDNLTSFLQYVRQFQHELQSTDQNEDVKVFVHGFVNEVMEQVLTPADPDEDFIWDFFYHLFRDLRSLGLLTAGFYCHAIGQMLILPRYGEYTNQRKIFLELYRQYKEDSLRDLDPLERPPKGLIERLMRQHGSQGSIQGVNDMVSDWRIFYPDKPFSSRTLGYLMHFYANHGLVDQVHEQLEVLRTHSPDYIDLHVLSALPYAYARRVDIPGTVQQFRRISEEFGFTPDTACWNILLLAYTRADDLDGALECFNNMLESGVIPDRYTFVPLLDLCSYRGDIEAFEALYSKAEQLKIPLQTNVKARAGYVQACLRSDDPEGAEAVAQGMLNSYNSGTLRGSLTHTWNLLIGHYASTGDVMNSRRLYKQMIENKIPLDSWTYGALMRSLIEVRQTNAAFKILRVTMPINNVQVHALHYALVITGFIREGQYDQAMRAHKRMVERNIKQTASSRQASLLAIGIKESLKLRQEKVRNPHQRLIALEESLREILFENYESELADRQPRHAMFIDSRKHSVPDGYFGLLIFLYSTRGAYEICKELFEAASMAHADEANYETPLSLLTAIMEAYYRAGEYEEVASCWELARAQADKLVKTMQQAIDPQPPKVEFDFPVDSALHESADASRIATSRRQVLVRATRIYIRSLLSQENPRSLQEAQRTISSLLSNGYVIDNITWNEFIQMLARRGNILDAFSASEKYLMPHFPGWRQLSPHYIRQDRPGYSWMELRHYEVTRKTIMPRYKTLVILAATYAQIRRDEANGMGYNPKMGGWVREVLEQISPSTLRAIVTMPRTGDRLQRKYLQDM